MRRESMFDGRDVGGVGSGGFKVVVVFERAARERGGG
jgi:hypothetical protein